MPGLLSVIIYFLHITCPRYLVIAFCLGKAVKSALINRLRFEKVRHACYACTLSVKANDTDVFTRDSVEHLSVINCYWLD